MYKILIVEDELFVRMGLKMSVNWQEHGFQIVGEVSNGLQALEFIKKDPPDIVLTDIKMPFMDGVTLIKKISNSFPTIKCIVLSNYDDFDLVKEALKSGAENYFLKVTIMPEELIKSLKDVCIKIEAKRSSFTEKANQSVDYNERKNKSKFFHDLIRGKLSGKMLNSDIEKLGLHFNIARGLLFYITIENQILLLEQRYQGNEALLKEAVINVLSEIVEQGYKGEIFECNQSIIILIASDEQSLKPIDTHTFAQQVRLTVYQFLNISLRVVYDMFYDSYETLQYYFSKSTALEHLGFYDCDEALIAFTDHQPFSNEFEELYKLRDQFNTSILYNNIKNSLNAAEAFFSQAKEKRNNPVDVKNILISIFGYLEEELNKRDKDYLPSINTLQVASQLASCVTVDAVEHYFYDNIFDLAENIVKEVDGQVRGEIMRAMEYINLNYSDKISLDDIAKHASMNKSYFSRFFKNETSINIQDYIIRIRMEKASEMLQELNTKIADIAVAVGYNDIYYFDRSFKKYFGMSPSQYRRNLHIK